MRPDAAWLRDLAQIGRIGQRLTTQIAAGPGPPLLGRRAGEIRGFVGTSGSFVYRYLRVGTQRAGTVQRPVGLVFGDDLRWRFTIFPPLLDGG